jgi:hypothetical protein
MKRIFDIVFSCIALFVFAVLMLVIAVVLGASFFAYDTRFGVAKIINNYILVCYKIDSLQMSKVAMIN